MELRDEAAFSLFFFLGSIDILLENHHLSLVGIAGYCFGIAAAVHLVYIVLSTIPTFSIVVVAISSRPRRTAIANWSNRTEYHSKAQALSLGGGKKVWPAARLAGGHSSPPTGPRTPSTSTTTVSSSPNHEISKLATAHVLRSPTHHLPLLECPHCHPGIHRWQRSQATYQPTSPAVEPCYVRVGRGEVCSVVRLSVFRFLFSLLSATILMYSFGFGGSE